MERLDLDIHRGDDESYEFVVKRLKVPFPLAGCFLWFTAKRSITDTDAQAQISKDSSPSGGIAITDAPAGKGVLFIDPDDTANLVVPTNVAERDKSSYKHTLFYDLQLKTTGNEIFTVAHGRLNVEPDITQAVT